MESIQPGKGEYVMSNEPEFINNAAGSMKPKRRTPAMTGAIAAVAASLVMLSSPAAQAEQPDIVVYKTSTCGCCKNWVAHVRDAGFKVNVVNLASTQPVQKRVGVPQQIGSCHTAVAGDYWVEGHVPADLVQRLLTESPPDIRGIAVPGMPAGSPGMEGPKPVQYNVIAYDTGGKLSVYAKR